MNIDWVEIWTIVPNCGLIRYAIRVFFEYPPNQPLVLVTYHIQLIYLPILLLFYIEYENYITTIINPLLCTRYFFFFTPIWTVWFLSAMSGPNYYIKLMMYNISLRFFALFSSLAWGKNTLEFCSQQLHDFLGWVNPISYAEYFILCVSNSSNS